MMELTLTLTITPIKGLKLIFGVTTPEKIGGLKSNFQQFLVE